MISLPIHNVDGQPTGQNYEFDPAELADGINKQLLHDAVVMYQANLRQGTFKTKTRSEVSGCSKKMYKQKGTGNARAGGKRSPVRRGGGHAFAKRPVDFSYRLPRKALQIATRMALLSKFLDNEVVVVDKLAFDTPQTKRVHTLLKTLGLVDQKRAVDQDGKPGKRPVNQSCLVAIAEHDPVVWKSARNIPAVGVSPAADLNAYQLLQRRRLVVTVQALDKLRESARESRSGGEAV